MVKKKENVLALGMYCLIIAITIQILGDGNILIDFASLFFILMAIFSIAIHVVNTSSVKKKK
ncbi:MAG: hypothetical protein KGD66_05540 [Candidatus Lokiarchaeota archaeon]|nr:hypothetical protein [Candidatus Lokiarchaeota archaeon]